jgi:hypothetical protein
MPSAILDFTISIGMKVMKNVFGIWALSLALVTAGLAQAPAKPEAPISGDITGLYSWVHEGEFVQIEVNEGKVTGLVSHFKDEDLDKAQFVDQFFEQAKLEGATLTFRTKPSGGAWFEFSGIVERGSAKTPSDEGYWNVRGTLRERGIGADGKVTEKTHELTLKSFPQDATPNATQGKETEGAEKKN